MTALESHPDGTIVPVKAHAGARRNAIKTGPEGSLHVSITQAPEKGKANQAIIARLAEFLGVRKSQIALLAGATSPQKRLLVRGIAPAELEARIRRALGGA